METVNSGNLSDTAKSLLYRHSLHIELSQYLLAKSLTHYITKWMGINDEQPLAGSFIVIEENLKTSSV